MNVELTDIATRNPFIERIQTGDLIYAAILWSGRNMVPDALAQRRGNLQNVEVDTMAEAARTRIPSQTSLGPPSPPTSAAATLHASQ